MTSKFTEILDTSNEPTYTHPHLNVSLEDVLAEEGRKRSSSDSAAGYSAASSSPTSSPRSGSRSPEWTSQTQEAKDSLKRRLTFGRRRTKE